MKWLFGICIVLFSACQQEEKPKYTKLTGHWHVFHREDTIDCYEIIDFEGSTTFYEGAYKDIYRDRYNKGYADFPNQKLYFSPVSGRLTETYKYEFQGDTILLKCLEPYDYVIEYEYYAVKVDKKQCSWYKDAFCCLGLSAELPIVIEDKGLNDLPVLGLQITLQIGYPKFGKSDSISVREMYSYEDINAEDIPLIIEKSYIVTNILRRGEIQLAFYADKETKVKHLKPILQKLAEITDRPKVVLVFQYNPQLGDFELFGKEVIFEGVDWQEVEDEMFFADYVLGQN